MYTEIIKFDKYEMRQITLADIDDYYSLGFESADFESSYFTGTTEKHSKERVQTYVENVIKDNSRLDYLISKDGMIIGEIVINNIKGPSAHYRICIFNKEYFSRGIGYKATVKLFEFAFRELDLETIELEVFPFNERAISLYKKLGFEVTDHIYDSEANEPYREIERMVLNRRNFETLCS